MTLLVDLPENEKLLLAAEIDLELTEVERATVIAQCKSQGHYFADSGKVGAVAFVLNARKLIAGRAAAPAPSPAPPSKPLI